LKHADLLKIGAGYVTQDIWKDWYQTFQRHRHESARESAIYNKLKKGPVFEETIKHTIPREALVEEIRRLTTPAEEGRRYPLVIGEHGTGKTSLIKLAVSGIGEPKGVIYVDIPLECDEEADVAEVVRIGLGWSRDPIIDSSERNYSSSLLIVLKANRFAAASLREILQYFSRLAIKYKQEYGKVPVLIIDNANRLAQKQQKLLNLFQDYAKNAADKWITTVVFMSSEGRVPRDMMSKSIMFMVLFWLLFAN
jgi:Cdc6-like AAA superfamily ATPase